MAQDSAHRRRTFVLVHGMWVGGWAWSQVAPLLRAAGHDVYTPTLTGYGERVHLRHPGITLDTHVLDITNVLRYEDLHEVILVGWSYAGMVITGVAEQAPDRLAHLVYLDAFVPQDGQSVADLIGSQATAGFEEIARTQGDGWLVPYPGPNNDNLPLTDVLFNPAKQPLAVKNAQARALPHTYIYCTDKPDSEPDVMAASARYAQAAAGWRYRTFSGDHNAVLTMPRELADLLLELA